MPVPTPTPLPPQSSRCCSFCRRQPCASSCRAHCRRWPTCYAPACRAPGERPGSAPGPRRGAWGGPLLRLPACLAACRGGPPLTAPLTQPSAVPPAVSQRRCARCAGVHGEAAGAPLPALCVRGPAERWVPRCRCRRRPVPPPLLDGWRQRSARWASKGPHASHPVTPHPALPLLAPLAAACPPKGYTAHVLGYTVHAVIEGVAAVGQPGCLDDSLLQILPLMEVRAGGLCRGAGDEGWGGRAGSCTHHTHTTNHHTTTTQYTRRLTYLATWPTPRRPPSLQERTRRRASAAATTPTNCWRVSSPLGTASRSC